MLLLGEPEEALKWEGRTALNPGMHNIFWIGRRSSFSFGKAEGLLVKDGQKRKTKRKRVETVKSDERANKKEEGAGLMKEEKKESAKKHCNAPA